MKNTKHIEKKLKKKDRKKIEKKHKSKKIPRRKKDEIDDKGTELRYWPLRLLTISRRSGLATC